jgi:hypothetical protein
VVRDVDLTGKLGGGLVADQAIVQKLSLRTWNGISWWCCFGSVGVFGNGGRWLRGRGGVCETGFLGEMCGCGGVL